MLSRVSQEILKKRPLLYCAIVNKYTEPDSSSFLASLGCKEIENLDPNLKCFVSPSAELKIPPSPQKSKLLYYYAVDVASLLPVLALRPDPNDMVLDMCAAPGGKAFALLQLLCLGEGGLALNDPSRSRMARLKTVVSQCIPRGLKYAVRFTHRRGEDWGRIEPRTYDKVLVDAPCSAERHHIEEWSSIGQCYPNTEMFGVLQQKLLLAALHAVKCGGVAVYSTCTMSVRENDSVVRNTLQAAGDQGMKVVLQQTNCDPLLQYCSITNTDFGKLVSPEPERNCGPTFTSKLQLLS